MCLADEAYHGMWMTSVLFRLLLLYRVVVLRFLLWCPSLRVSDRIICVLDTFSGRLSVTVLLPMPMMLLEMFNLLAEVRLIVVNVLPTLSRLRLVGSTLLPL